MFLECDIRASPWVSDIGWRFEGRDLSTNISAGIIVSNQSLVLQKVDRRSRGRYTCTGTNSEGQGESNQVNLRVRCEFNSSLPLLKNKQICWTFCSVPLHRVDHGLNPIARQNFLEHLKATRGVTNCKIRYTIEGVE